MLKTIPTILIYTFNQFNHIMYEVIVFDVSRSMEWVWERMKYLKKNIMQNKQIKLNIRCVCSSFIGKKSNQ